jgi:hypothetical protein
VGGFPPTTSHPCATTAGSHGQSSRDRSKRPPATTSRSRPDRSHDRYHSEQASDRGVPPRGSARRRPARLHLRAAWTTGRSSPLLGRSGDPLAL